MNRNNAIRHIDASAEVCCAAVNYFLHCDNDAGEFGRIVVPCEKIRDKQLIFAHGRCINDRIVHINQIGFRMEICNIDDIAHHPVYRGQSKFSDNPPHCLKWLLDADMLVISVRNNSAKWIARKSMQAIAARHLRSAPQLATPTAREFTELSGDLGVNAIARCLGRAPITADIHDHHRSNQPAPVAVRSIFSGYGSPAPAIDGDLDDDGSRLRTRIR